MDVWGRTSLGASLGRCPVRVFFATAVLIAVLGFAARPAAAGTFHVYGLGLNSAGCPNGWVGQSSLPSKFRFSDRCSSYEIESTRDGASIPNGHFAAAHMFTAQGARFSGFSIRVRGNARHGMQWKMAMCERPYTGCVGHIPAQWAIPDTEYALGTLSPNGQPVYATHLYAGVDCAASSCADPASDGTRAAQIEHRETHAVVDDYTPPQAPGLDGVSSGWNSGAKQLSYSASDAGSGVESVTLTVDGSLHRTNTHSCKRLPSGGYHHPVPCALSTTGTFGVNQPGQLADGPHTLSVTARDAGGAEATASQEFLVDNNAPGHPLNLSVSDRDG